MKFLSSKHRLDDEKEPTTLEMPSRSTTIPTVESLLETNQNDVEELQTKPKKADQRYLSISIIIFHIFYSIYTFRMQKHWIYTQSFCRAKLNEVYWRRKTRHYFIFLNRLFFVCSYFVCLFSVSRTFNCISISSL